MDRFAVFVDAGYLFAASKTYFNEVSQEEPVEVRLDFQQFLNVITELSETLTGRQILRIYWYDASPDGLPTRTHEALAFMDNVKLRLGMFNGAGQQKGVDTMVVADMLSLSRNRAISDAILISGDVDLLIGIQQAQELGVRVHLIGLESSQHKNQSARLKWDCDTTRNLSADDIRAFISPLHRREAITSLVSPARPISDPPLTVGGDIDWNEVANLIVASIAEPDRNRIGALTKYAHWGPRLHGKMLGICKSIINRETLHDEQQHLRELVWKKCRENANKMPEPPAGVLEGSEQPAAAPAEGAEQTAEQSDAPQIEEPSAEVSPDAPAPDAPAAVEGEPSEASEASEASEGEDSDGEEE